MWWWVAMLGGYKSILAISEWGANYRLNYLKALGSMSMGIRDKPAGIGC